MNKQNRTRILDTKSVNII
uniref:Uncharacterized protein n=1 Tax=Rhizophora mucronata TaxID=61149 RepID=A0A2P2N809_RHIMU